MTKLSLSEEYLSIVIQYTVELINVTHLINKLKKNFMIVSIGVEQEVSKI